MKYWELNKNKIVDNIYWGDINGPTYVYIEITRKCNCKCNFCQVDDPICKDIDLQMYKSIIQQLKDINCFEIRIGGGEPLLCSNLLKVLEMSKDFSVWICTNGILLNDEMCKILKRNNVVGVRVSLDSLNEQKHNTIRQNKHAFIKAIQGMECAKRNGLSVCLSMTVGAHNIDEIESMKIFAQKNGYCFLTHFIMPIGKGKIFLSKNAIPYQKVKSILSTEEDSEINCVAGTQSFSMDIDGNVSACTFLKPIENIKNKTLKEIIISHEFNKYKCAIPESEHCKNCEFKKTLNNGKCLAKSVCKGGCWALYEQEN